MFTNQAQANDWGYTEDSWQDGWDVLIPWEADLARRVKEHEEFLSNMQGGVKGPGITGTGMGPMSSAGAATATPTATTTAVSTGGA